MTKFISEAEREYILTFANAYVKSNDFDEIFEEFPGAFFTGCTKMVFVLDNLENWVIKIDLGEKPYCQREADNYTAAVKENLAEYFAATFFFAEVEGVKFYIQELVDCHDDFGDDLSCEISEICFDHFKESSSYESDDEIWDAVGNMNDIERVFALMPYASPYLKEFISCHEINDLHTGNFGRRGNDYVIMDFSGFGW